MHQHPEVTHPSSTTTGTSSDPVELAALAQRGGFTKPVQEPVGVLSVDADRLGQRQVLVGSVPAHTLGLDEHAGSIPRHRLYATIGTKVLSLQVATRERLEGLQSARNDQICFTTLPKPRLVSKSGVGFEGPYA
jgi:hypothetical protein